MFLCNRAPKGPSLEVRKEANIWSNSVLTPLFLPRAFNSNIGSKKCLLIHSAVLFCSTRESYRYCKGRTLKNQAKTLQEFHRCTKVVSMTKQPENVDGESANLRVQTKGILCALLYRGLTPEGCSDQASWAFNTFPQGAVPYPSGGGTLDPSQMQRKTVVSSERSLIRARNSEEVWVSRRGLLN